MEYEMASFKMYAKILSFLHQSWSKSWFHQSLKCVNKPHFKYDKWMSRCRKTVLTSFRSWQHQFATFEDWIRQEKKNPNLLRRANKLNILLVMMRFLYYTLNLETIVVGLAWSKLQHYRLHSEQPVLRFFLSDIELFYSWSLSSLTIPRGQVCFLSTPHA